MPSAALDRVGVLMLDTRFPRPPGDIGHPDSWLSQGITPLYQVVQGAFPTEIVQSSLSSDWLRPFEQAALNLVNLGAQAITTSCGFLGCYQPALQALLPVPVYTSALLWCRLLPAPGVLTFDRMRLGRATLKGTGVPESTPIVGVRPNGEFHRCILNNLAHMNLDLACEDVVDAARELVTRHPQVKQIVLECTNMPPYAKAITAATGRPTLGLIDGICDPVFVRGVS